MQESVKYKIYLQRRSADQDFGKDIVSFMGELLKILSQIFVDVKISIKKQES